MIPVLIQYVVEYMGVDLNSAPRWGAYAVNPYVHDLDTDNNLGKVLSTEDGKLQTLCVYGMPMPQTALAPLSIEEQKLLASYRKIKVQVKPQRKRKVNGDPAFFTSMDLNQVTVILNTGAEPSIGKTPQKPHFV